MNQFFSNMASVGREDESLVRENNSIQDSVSATTRTGSCSYELVQTIKLWSQNEKQVPHDAVKRLLDLLQKNFPNIPKSYKGLNKTMHLNIESMGKGEYFHFPSWVENIKRIVISNNTTNIDKIHLAINIDGIPINNDSRFHTACPILVKVLEAPSKIITA